MFKNKKYLLEKKNFSDMIRETKNTKFFHISFDDVEKSLNNLQNNTYESIWEEPFFKWLSKLHNKTGAKFSLYVYSESLKNFTKNKYAKEFFLAKDWLKFGLHTGSINDYAQSTYKQGMGDWNRFVKRLKRITGSYSNIDRIPRLHCFSGNEEALKGMRDAKCGALGFLTSDDKRNSYYLGEKIKDFLYDNDHVIDNKNKLIFISTKMRADWFNVNFSSVNIYKAPIKDNVYDELVRRFKTKEYANSIQSFIFFGHEWDLYNGIEVFPGVAKRYEDACLFANNNKIDFDFPENRVFNKTPKDIN